VDALTTCFIAHGTRGVGGGSGWGESWQLRQDLSLDPFFKMREGNFGVCKRRKEQMSGVGRCGCGGW
jgi:hypothetical protein